jgi:hypothetical protein
MALTDDHPIQITSPDYRPSHRSELEEWLRKEAEGGLKPEDNEAVSTTQYSELEDKPKGRKDVSNIDGHWGEGSKSEPFHNNDETYAASQKERKDVSSRSFATFPAAAKADQALVSANFEHARSGNFTTHSVLLQDKTKEGSASLSERVRSLVDRF